MSIKQLTSCNLSLRQFKRGIDVNDIHEKYGRDATPRRFGLVNRRGAYLKF